MTESNHQQRHKAILLFGAPGTGKGTQGAMLGCIPGFYHLSTGDMFRNLDTSSEIGRVFMEYSSRGELVPDDVTIKVWKHYVAELIEVGGYDPARHVLLLDGIPRSSAQAELMDPLVDVLHIVCLTCKDDSEMIERLRKRAEKQGRPDDAKEEVIKRRLEVYRSETKPVLSHYDPSLVSEIDAVGTPAEVLMRVLEKIAPVQKREFGLAGV